MELLKGRWLIPRSNCVVTRALLEDQLWCMQGRTILVKEGSKIRSPLDTLEDVSHAEWFVSYSVRE